MRVKPLGLMSVAILVVVGLSLTWLLTNSVAGADEPTILFQDAARGIPVGNSATVIVEASGMPAGTDAMQVDLLHSANFSVANLLCLGPFAAASESISTSTTGTLLGCSIVSADVTSTNGNALSFDLTRAWWDQRDDHTWRYRFPEDPVF